MITATRLDAFRQEIEQAGLIPPATIIADGKLHRFSSSGVQADDAGWYIYFPDETPAGVFGCWRKNFKQTWSGKADSTLTAAERERQRTRFDEARRQREHDERLRHTEAAHRAQAIWNQAAPALEDHPYLRKKGIQPHGVRVDEENRLIVPVRIDGSLTSTQSIDGTGAKLFLPGGAVKGGSYTIGDLTEATTVLICEGFATGASLHEATGYPVVVAFSANNLTPVAQQLRHRFPTATMLICGDNDVRTDGTPNTGRDAAVSAAEAVHGMRAEPKAVDGTPTDWNDVTRRYGLDAVRMAITAALQREGTTTMENGHINKTSTSSHSTGPGGPGGPSSMLERGKPVAHPPNDTGPGGPQKFPPVPGYRVEARGVFEIQVDETKPDVRITLAPCGVLAHCRDGGRENWGAFLRWIDRDDHCHEAAVPVGRFHEAGGTLPVELANAGLPIMPGMERKLLRYFANGNPETRYRAAIQTGWQEEIGVFVLPQQSLGAPPNGELVVYQPERYSPTKQSVRTGGMPEEWERLVAAPCAGNPILVFWLSSALAAPLLHLLDLEGGGFHLYGITSQGKTTAEQIAASAWGDGADPAEGRLSAFVKKWNLTKNATEGLAEAHNDLPLCLDEVGEADARDFGRTIYQLAGGQGKGRMKADATLKQVKGWRTLILSTGEVATAEVVESEGRRLKGGQAVRLVDIPATHPIKGDGILVQMHGAASSAALADALKRACRTHYGWAGPAFVAALIAEGVPAVRAELRDALDATVETLHLPGDAPEVGRVLKRLALVAVAGEKAIALGLVPWTPGEAVRAVKEIKDRYIHARGGTGGEPERLVECLKAFLLANASSRFRDLNQEETIVYNLAGYRDASTETFYFTPDGLKEACGGVDATDTARSLKTQGFLRVPDSGHLQERVTVPGLGRTRLYAVLGHIVDRETVPCGPVAQ